MTKENLEYWTNFSFDKMKKDGAIMPTIISKVLELEEFKNSGVSEDQLRQSIKERFIKEREKMVNDAKEKLKILRQKDNE